MEKLNNLGSSLEKISLAAGTQVGTVVSQTSQKAASYVNRTKSYVEANPLRSVAIAAATGLAIGGLLALATRKKLS